MALLTTSFIYDVIIVLVTLYCVIWTFFQRRFNHWKSKNIPYIQPSFPHGNFKGLSIKQSLGQIAADICKENNEKKMIGVYMFSNPVILINDVDLLKSILIKDFAHFHDRGFNTDPEHDPLTGHLFLLNGKEWRNLRTKLTPIFTSGKMKMMFPTILDVGEKLELKFSQTVNDVETEIKDLLARFTMDVISTCAFGLESNCLENPNSEFRKIGLELTQTQDWKRRILSMLFFAFPNISQYIKIRFVPKHISDFFIGTVRNTMEYREKNDVKRNDFLQLLLQIKNLGYVTDADSQKTNLPPKSGSKPFTIEVASAQAFLFFFAGFETSSSTMSFGLYELALNPEIQSKLQSEIDGMLRTNNNKITYEALNKLDYLDRVVSEILRMYPIAQTILRACTSNYKVPGTDWIIEKGTNVWIPMYKFHHDENIYPNPSKFDPDRFLPEEKEKRNHYSYLPFGEGPRNCIGNRFGLMQTKVGLAVLLSKFNFSTSKNTMIPMKFEPTTDLLSAAGPLFLKVSSRAIQ